MKKLVITLNVGQDELAASSLPSITAYARRIGAKFVHLTGKAGWPHPTHEKWRYHKYVESYDRTIVVDTDCWIHPSCPDLFELVPESHIGMNRVDQWLPRHFRWRQRTREIGKLTGLEIPFEAYRHYYNCGVWVGSQQHADYWKPPPDPRPLTEWCDEEQWGRIQISRNNWPVFDIGKQFNYQWYLDKTFSRLLTTRPWIVHLAGMTTPSERNLRPSMIRLLDFAYHSQPVVYGTP